MILVAFFATQILIIMEYLRTKREQKIAIIEQATKPETAPASLLSYTSTQRKSHKNINFSPKMYNLARK